MNRTSSMNETKATMFVFAGNNGHPEKSKVSAGKEAIRIARECIRNKWDFTVETTLAGGNVVRQMRAAKEQGFKIIIFYVG